jgi:lipopolysaccharide export system protein LptC
LDAVLALLRIVLGGPNSRRWHPTQRRRQTGLWMLTGYSRFVGMMKLALPATAVAILGIIFAWPRLAPRDEQFQVAFANFNAKSVDTQSMVNPRYYGTDDKNQPFTLTAEIGTQIDQQAQQIQLEKPVADLTRPNGGGMVGNSDLGIFQQKDSTLELYGHVDLFQDKGYEVHSSSAHIDVLPGNAQGQEPTHGKGPAGTVEGQGFRLWDRGDRILFTGKARAVLNVSKSSS